MVEGTSMGGGIEASFGQAFFEGVGLTTMDLDKRLRCLSRNPILKLEAISSSSFSSLQIIVSTTRSTPSSGSSLENEDDEDDETNGEDEDVGGEVLTLQTGQAVGFFFF
ncbi:hypothetical protein PVL29_019505 [Vitis rotundifolia]|uniref:Uncharacterized protein n=1 Tax=Vitis rotundifolia TaxID=103349 RepID=A0AA38Z1F5_VITRO|nr:hypothetical protein PVL29_019505 [Vitis rotundifolia]